MLSDCGQYCGIVNRQHKVYFLETGMETEPAITC